MTYYFSEVGNPNSYCKAEEIKAENLTAAKRMASRRQVFLDTCLKKSFLPLLTRQCLGG